MNEIQNKLWNIELLVEEIKKFPQTYKTILKEKCSDGTCQTLLRRKLNNLFKEGIVCKSTIPGTRFGQAIIYSIPKEYSIIVEASRVEGSRVFCFFKHKKISRFYIELEEYWKLSGDEWIKINETKTIFEGHVLKWI